MPTLSSLMATSESLLGTAIKEGDKNLSTAAAAAAKELSLSQIMETMNGNLNGAMSTERALYTLIQGIAGGTQK